MLLKTGSRYIWLVDFQRGWGRGGGVIYQFGIFFVAQKLHLETGSSFDYQRKGGGEGI